MREAVVAYTEYKLARKERNGGAAAEYFSDYTMHIRTLKLRYQDEQDPDLARDCSAAIERMIPAFSPLYAPSQVVPEVCINESMPGAPGDDILESD